MTSYGLKFSQMIPITIACYVIKHLYIIYSYPVYCKMPKKRHDGASAPTELRPLWAAVGPGSSSVELEMSRQRVVLRSLL